MHQQPKSVRAVFDRALEIEAPAARKVYLEEACAGDPELRREVESLLRAHGQAGDFLDRPAVEQVSAAPPPLPDATVALDAGAKEGAVAARPDRPDPADTQAESGGQDPETPLDFLQPSAAPGSLGRLAHYEIREVLGQGGFGIVLKAFDEKLHRIVALKVMAPHLAATSPARKRFLREARASAAIRHENVVAIYAVDDQPIPYLVMEYIAGQTLQDRLDGNGPLDLKETLRIGRQVAAGLAAAHVMGIIHRDVKPANILLESGVDHVKITDFGLARAADDASVTQSGVVAGTPMYMAPEQARGETLDHRADLFSLGSVLYVMCTGRPPFRASTTFAVLKRVAEDTPRPIREIIPEVPEWLCAIIAKLHAKKPEDRYASAKEVADLLARYLSELQLRGAVSSPPPGPVTPERSEPPRESLVLSPVAPRARRSGRRWMAAAAVFLLLLAGLGVTEVTGVTHFAGAALRLFHPHREVPPGSDEPPPLAVAPFDAQQARAYQEAWAKHLGVPVAVENSIGMKLRLVPPGEFVMGSSPEEVDAVLKETDSYFAAAVRGEVPARRVRIADPFYLGAYEVTVGQFSRFVAESGYRTWAELSGRGSAHWDDTANKAVLDPTDVWNSRRLAPTDEYPAGAVAYRDARAFCDWLGVKEGRRYVLPDEEQWEYACRAGTTGRWCSGNEEEWAGATPEARALRGGQHDNTVWVGRSASRLKAQGDADGDPWTTWGFRLAVVGDLSKFKRP